MKTSHTFIPTCCWCRKLMNLGTPYFIIGNSRVHPDCLEQWKKDDPLEWEGMPEPEVA